MNKGFHPILTCRWFRLSILLTVFTIGAGASAQLGIGASIPETASLTISHTQVIFDLAQEIYPPPQFPAFYSPTEPDTATDPMWFTVFTNLNKWSIVVAFTGLYNAVDNVILPARQLEYSTDGGITWHPFSPGNNTIVVGTGPTTVHETYTFATRLKIDGSEPPGTYVGTLTFTLSPD